MPQGKFITFEGGEGAGKSTLINEIGKYLQIKNKKFIQSREPGGTEQGKQLRKVLLDKEGLDWHPLSETLILLADRSEHLQQIIRPALKRGDWVLCDRYMDSTYAYQVTAGNLSPETLNKLQEDVIKNTIPNITFLLDIPVEIGLERATNQGRFEAKGAIYHQKVRKGFLESAKKNPKRFIILDATKTISNLTQEVIHHIETRL